MQNVAPCLPISASPKVMFGRFGGGGISGTGAFFQSIGFRAGWSICPNCAASSTIFSTGLKGADDERARKFEVGAAILCGFQNWKYQWRLEHTCQ
jgi:hypothetical protein